MKMFNGMDPRFYCPLGILSISQLLIYSNCEVINLMYCMTHFELHLGGGGYIRYVSPK